MASKENKKPTLENELDEVQVALSRTEQFIEKNQKTILIGIAIVIAVVGGYFGFKHGYLIPKEKKAEAAMFMAEEAFIAKDYQKALDGDGVNLGFIAIADEYALTKSATLAKAYAGLSLMQLKKYDEAISVLKSFNADDELISPAILGAVGDCYVELDKNDEAVSYFKKAADKADNELLSPVYLMKAGRVYEALGKYSNAVKCYETIKEKYYLSQEAQDIDKFIERAKAL